MSISKELISLREASKISGYHSDYLSFLIRKSKLNGQRIGRMWLVDKSELEHFLKSKESPQKSSLGFFRKMSKAIFTTFLMFVFIFFTIQILTIPKEHVKVANNTSQKNDF